jgi:predicted lipoprotein with Yx(FWY)xxD motif
MHLRPSAIAAAAVVAAAVPAGLLAAGAGASIAREAAAPATTTAKAPTVALRSTKRGKILVDGRTGHALYLFAQDGKNKSTCTGQCAAIWPPLTASGKLSAGAGVSRSKLGLIKRGSRHQVTYAGHPLYTFTSDTSAGQTSGEGVNSFYVVSASGSAIK